MKKLICSFILLIFTACGTQKKVVVDPFVGAYDMTVFEVTQIGDIPLKLIIKKEKGGYVSELETNSQDPAASEYLWEVTSTSIDDDIIYIDATIANYDLSFELNVYDNDISGSMMGMFDVEGIKLQ
tara:strand:+ start:334 stop:711 length:378 start_codon:yes stop_codon:yes gene_type:complete